MDKYDYLLDSLFESELMESLSSNQEIPGQLGNNINGVTNLDLTNQEELLTSGLYDDGWDESSSSGFEDLPLTDEDIQLECIFESSLYEDAANVNNKYDNKADKINRKYNRKKAKLERKKKVADHNNIDVAAKRDYHKDMSNNTSGIRKSYHKIKAKRADKKLGKVDRKIEKNQNKRNNKLVKNQMKRAKALS